jgi:type II secretory ATPase GspE/PulE/Tfp pilus assembly ATPase PilB-like protein
VVDARDARTFCVDTEAVVFEAVGCEKCAGLGYRGRSGLFELLTVDDAMRTAIAAREGAVEVARRASEIGYRGMLAHGVERALAGETTIEELRRIFVVRER